MSVLVSAVAVVALVPAVSSAQPAGSIGKVGVYDSRQVAFARFWRPEYQVLLKQRTAEGRAAKATGDETKFRAVADLMKAEQTRLHLAVFSTAPLDGAEDQAWLATRLPEVARAAGVARVVSKWDAAALAGVPAAQQVDVTELLIRDCRLDAPKRNMLADIGRSTPLPLEQARKLDAEGKL